MIIVPLNSSAFDVQRSTTDEHPPFKLDNVTNLGITKDMHMNFDLDIGVNSQSAVKPDPPPAAECWIAFFITSSRKVLDYIGRNYPMMRYEAWLHPCNEFAKECQSITHKQCKDEHPLICSSGHGGYRSIST